MSQINVGKLSPQLIAALKDFPLMQPPPGVTPNFANPTYVGHQVIVAGAIGAVVLAFMLIIRIYAKVFLVKRVSWDDYVYFVGWIAGVIYIAINMASMQTGVFGYHAWEVQLGDFSVSVLALYRSISILNGPLSWLQKLALFALIYTAFQPLRWTRILIYIGVIVSGVVYISSSIVSGIFCGPKDGSDLSAYLYGMAGPDCASTEGIVLKYGIAVAFINLFIDFYIMIIPLPAVWKLQVSPKKKIGIYLVFLTGFGACIASIVSIAYRFNYAGSPDITYNMVPMATVLIWETTIGLMVPCAASSAKIYNHVKAEAPSLFSLSNFSSYFGRSSKTNSSKKSTLPSFVDREKHEEQEKYRDANKARINFKSWFRTAGTDTQDTGLSTTRAESVYDGEDGMGGQVMMHPLDTTQAELPEGTREKKDDTITCISPVSTFKSPREAPLPPTRGSGTSDSHSPEPGQLPPTEPFTYIPVGGASLARFPRVELVSPGSLPAELSSHTPPTELSSHTPPTELSSRTPPTELSSATPPTELPSPPPHSHPQLPQTHSRQLPPTKRSHPPQSHLKYSAPTSQPPSSSQHPHPPDEPLPRSSAESTATLPACPYPPERPDPRDNVRRLGQWMTESWSRRGSRSGMGTGTGTSTPKRQSGVR